MTASRTPSPAAGVPLGVAVLDAVGSIVAADAGFGRLAGKDAAALPGTPFFETFASTEEIRAHGRAYREAAVPAEATFASPGLGTPDGELRLRFLSFGQGAARHAVVLVEDAAELGRLRAVEAQFELALEAASHVRHQINNSLMGILGHLEILLAQAGVPEPIRRRAEVLLREVEKIRDDAAVLQTFRRE